MIVVHFVKVSALYPCVVISSLIKRLQNLHATLVTCPGWWDVQRMSDLAQTLACMPIYLLALTSVTVNAMAMECKRLRARMSRSP
jgi:hypothetical protein